MSLSSVSRPGDMSWAHVGDVSGCEHGRDIAKLSYISVKVSSGAMEGASGRRMENGPVCCDGDHSASVGASCVSNLNVLKVFLFDFVHVLDAALLAKALEFLFVFMVLVLKFAYAVVFCCADSIEKESCGTCTVSESTVEN